MCESNPSAAEPNPASSREASPASRLFDAARRGVNNAIDTAEKTVPQVGAAAEKAVETVAFGVVFAAVFPTALALHLVPRAMKSGGRRGMESARRSADRFTGADQPQPDPTA